MKVFVCEERSFGGEPTRLEYQCDDIRPVTGYSSEMVGADGTRQRSEGPSFFHIHGLRGAIAGKPTHIEVDGYSYPDPVFSLAPSGLTIVAVGRGAPI